MGWHIWRVCFQAWSSRRFRILETILVDNGSSDGSVAFVMGNFPWVHIVELPDNFGFSRAVNEGIYASRDTLCAPFE